MCCASVFPSWLGGGPITGSEDAVLSACRLEACIIRCDKVKLEARVGSSCARWVKAEMVLFFELGKAVVRRMVLYLAGQVMRLIDLQTRSD